MTRWRCRPCEVEWTSDACSCPWCGRVGVADGRSVLEAVRPNGRSTAGTDWEARTRAELAAAERQESKVPPPVDGRPA